MKVPVVLTDSEAKAILAYTGAVLKRWPGDSLLAKGHEKIDLALLKAEESETGKAR